MAIDCYIQITGIEGESTARGHEKWIKADGYTLGVESRGGHTTSLKDMVFTHPLDKATPKLVEACCNDTDIEKVKIHVLEEGREFIEYLLEPGQRGSGADAAVCRITAVIPTGNPGDSDRPREQVTVRYGKITVKYKDGNIEASYDSSTT
ncbi:MAG: hypothetical protein BWK77_02465 [Verrucomicrobia bacterium A1]|nr:MAG: hypothetical protein BWK77_02465 [Verrucomicrobia bacterium A1]